LSLVLDSSATLAWIVGDEMTHALGRVFDAVAERGAVVPSLWRLELANCLLVAQRRRRIDEEFRRAALADLSLLDIVVDAHTDANAWSDTQELAERFGLTLYDAAYIELASRRALPLATLDAEMRAAGRSLGLRLLGVE
jgi:predicted nucleic acid-binding protein